jgi:quinol monooxygenase YgiN
MIFVAGTLTVKPAVLAEFQKDVAAMAGRVRQEQGCHHYSLLAEDARSGLVNVLEQWTDDAALAVHLKQPWIVEFFNKYVAHLLAMNVKVYDISGERGLPTM